MEREDIVARGPRPRPLQVFVHQDAAYEPLHDLQRALQSAVFRGEAPETLLLVEHKPVITLGRSAKREHLLVEEARLNALGIELADVGRGGDITYHGPGQLVVYPIIDLSPDRCDVRRYMRDLEAVAIAVCAEFDIRAERDPLQTGVWVGTRKIAALGVRISRWVTMHGLALNVDPRLEHFALIVPCGIKDRTVTSIALEHSTSGTGGALPTPTLREVQSVWVRHFADHFGYTPEWPSQSENARLTFPNVEPHFGPGFRPRRP